MLIVDLQRFSRDHHIPSWYIPEAVLLPGPMTRLPRTAPRAGRPVDDPVYVRLIELTIVARKEARVRQTDLAAQLKQPQSYVSKVENLERRIDVAEYVAWMQALGVDPATHLAALTVDLASSRLSKSAL
jgi:hypothetical protein